MLAPLGEFALTARFDLLAVDEVSGRAVVVDWKTMRGERAMRSDFLRERVQTRVYLYALAMAGGPYRGEVDGPPGCEFHYWMANAPGDRWVRFVYDLASFERDRAYLTSLSVDAAARDGGSARPLLNIRATSGPPGPRVGSSSKARHLSRR